MISFKKFPRTINYKDTQKIERFIETIPELTEAGNKFLVTEEIDGDPFAVLAGKDATFGFSNGKKILAPEDDYRDFVGMLNSYMGQYLLKNLARWVGIQTANIELYGVIPKEGRYAPEGHANGFYITDVLIDNQLASPVYVSECLINNGLAGFYIPSVWVCTDVNEALAYQEAIGKDSLAAAEGFKCPMYGTRIKPYNFQKLSDKNEPFHIVQKFEDK